MDIINIKGLGPKTLEYLNKLNLYTIQDLIEYYPYRYNIIKISNIRRNQCINSSIIFFAINI